MSWHRDNQEVLRSNAYIEVEKAFLDGEDASNIGKKIILPGTFQIYNLKQPPKSIFDKVLLWEAKNFTANIFITQWP
jgi:hypothetical protein